MLAVCAWRGGKHCVRPALDSMARRPARWLSWPLPSPCRSLSTGRLTDLLLKAAFGTQAPDSSSMDSLHEKPMEVGVWWGPGGQWGRGGSPEAPRALSQRPLLALQGTYSQEAGQGTPAAPPLWCSPWARPPAGPRHPRDPAPGCSQVRTATASLAGGTMLARENTSFLISTSPPIPLTPAAAFVGSGAMGLGPQAEHRPHKQAPQRSL